jgi:adenosylcobinamide-GDP ribazoletransferase
VAPSAEPPGQPRPADAGEPRTPAGEPHGGSERWRSASPALALAVAFLTVVPVRVRAPAPPLGAAAGWFPAVGAAVGGVAGGLDYLAQPSLGPTVAAILAVGLLVGVTGGLHADGLADCGDALGARGDRARRLAIMRDSSIGTFGALALVLWMMLFVAAAAGFDREGALRSIVVAVGVGRWAAIVHARTAAPARADGLGAAFVVAGPAFAVATGSAVVLAVALLGPEHALVALSAAALLGLITSALARAGLGGRTGDTLGACVALTEAVVLVALLGAGVR